MKWDKQTLADLYWNKNFSSHEIAKQFDTNHFRVLRYMRMFEIPRRKNTIPARYLNPKINLSNISKEDLAYLAGIIDGEGTIRISKGGYEPLIRVTNNDKKLIEWSSLSKQPHYKTELQRTSDVIVVLSAIIPYLKVKQREANQILTELRERISNVVLNWYAEV